MVPVYSINSWFALRYANAAIYLDTIRACYEVSCGKLCQNATLVKFCSSIFITKLLGKNIINTIHLQAYVIFNFYAYMLDYLRQRPDWDLDLTRRPNQKHLWPFNYCFK